MDDQYSSWTALLYVFNLIVGTGALTLPKAFSDAGWIFSMILMVILAVLSYMTATFVIESMATCNAIIQWTYLDRLRRVNRYLRLAVQADSSDEEHGGEDDMLLSPEYIEHSFPSEPKRFFTLDLKMEMSQMASTVFNKFGLILFYICLCLYLYGDLTIYSAAVAKSLVDASCSGGLNASVSEKCWESINLSRESMYQVYLFWFLIFFGPYVFFDVQKTKYLQFVTSITRWLAFAVMIGLAVKRLTLHGAAGSPKGLVPSGLPALLGACVYSFMCHHSLPGMLAPISNKAKLFSQLALDYAFILLFYLTLSLTAVFAFAVPEDLYTLNFLPVPGSTIIEEIVSYFLTLFPVFTLTASFPIIAVTLRSNLQAMFSSMTSWTFQKVFIPCMTVVPPILIALTTENIEFLVSITGSYAGVAIQYVIPACLVILSRNSVPSDLAEVPNQYSSPFQSPGWPILVIVWAVICLILVTFNIIDRNIH